MDTIVPRKRGRTLVLAAAALLLAAAAALALWYWLPRGLQVDGRDLRIATVERGIFRDDIAVRASAAPLRAVILDSVESGRIEEVFARDGQLVDQGDLLFRISNPQRNLELLARQSELAQQISNLSTLRVAEQNDRSQRQRRLDDLAFALEQAQKSCARQQRLATEGFISAAALEESCDRRDKAQRALALEQASNAAEDKVRGNALGQLEEAIGGLRTGLQLVQATVDALAVRAPVAGRLTDFRLQVGESIVTGKNVGRIDDPARFKLLALIDEFYLSRVTVGRQGSVVQDGRRYPVRVGTVYPQIKEGRFTAELLFTQGQPDVLSPGQSVDAQITLGEPAPALLLPHGAFVNDSGGAWAFVLTDASHAERRAIRTGRRNNAQIEVLDGLRAGERVIVSGYGGFGKSTRLQISQ
ncbi:efflux RND transporter periplasmic adaptor subunit [Pseudoduganella chitinolytica]|uniref:HlyD family efflux transporter periplasmic adaptor subunit n=1 Tax=Pseudoduganella chitinolytica TaxID=34070 RepID=A0ABY8B7E8_9BURK|nr:HlyD family efflux transporter periplasmic adaptor subunit [Pseudoduganella chitinolytica]WEF31861.1 HlyD family efflux transporter periplasmic adaptor subunit [Pseudoduganella chitinolytica]